MNNSEQYYQPVLEALSAFVREGAKLPTTPPAPGLPTHGPPTDIQAALTVIERRPGPHGRVDLTEVNIAGADLTGGERSYANLSNATLSYANLRDVELTGATVREANLSRAKMLKANLSGANLTGANLSGADLSHATLDGQKQLDEACGLDAVLPPGLTLKPCPPRP